MRDGRLAFIKNVPSGVTAITRSSPVARSSEPTPPFLPQDAQNPRLTAKRGHTSFATHTTQSTFPPLQSSIVSPTTGYDKRTSRQLGGERARR